MKRKRVKQSFYAIEVRLTWIDTLIQAGYTHFDRPDVWAQLESDLVRLTAIAKQRGMSLLRAHRLCIIHKILDCSQSLAKVCFLLRKCEDAHNRWKFCNRSMAQYKVEVKPGNGPPDGAYFETNGALALNWFELPEHLPIHR